MRRDRRTYRPGGIIHAYQAYDPQRFPSPTQPGSPDLLSPAMNHLLMYGSLRRLSEEELARAVRLDPSQLGRIGPSLEALLAILRERKRKILERYEVDSVQALARRQYQQAGQPIHPSKKFRAAWQQAFGQQQIYLLERLWYAADRDRSPLARQLLGVIERLGELYQVDELAAKYTFTGRQAMTVPEALAVKEELEQIDELIRQLEEARQTAQIGVIDLEALEQWTEPGQVEDLRALQESMRQYLRDLAEHQGLESGKDGIRLTPKAYRLFQGKLLERIFQQLQPARTGRHQGPIQGEGAVELPSTKPYEFGDSVTQLDIPQTLINTMLRTPGQRPLRMRPEDMEVHRTRNRPKCATVVIMDMSGSMRYDGQYVHVKRMALALEGLIRREYPGDFLQFIEMYTFGRIRPAAEIVELLPKPVTLYDPIVRLKVDMSRPEASEPLLPPHFTNIQHSLRLARQQLAVQDSPNRQIVLITDGLPTAHFEDQWLLLLYPPDPRTEQATLREGLLCQREGITINLFLLPNWSQTEEDVRFAYRIAEATRGRVLFTAGRDLDRFVIWDYVQRKREILA